MGARAADREAMEIARGGSVDARRKLAARADLAPELLFFLAEDSDVGVRRSVAANPSTPRKADEFLARDADDAVRGAVAARVGAAAGELAGERRAQYRHITLEVMETLALDAAEKVRVRLAEAVKDVGTAPPGAVRRVIEVLARDTALEVAGPVLERSPLLSDEFLLGIVAAPANAGAVVAVSRRRGVSAVVADAIAECGDDAAIAVLLANESAQIREETLDRLIDQAPSRTAWHAPLVARPRLSAGHASKLARFVAIALVEELRKRTDLGPEMSARLAEAMTRRIEEDGAARAGPGGAEIDELSLSEALAAGRRAFVMAGLSLRSGLPEAVVHSMVNSGSPRAVTALSWKARMSMGFAEQLQLRLAYVEPRDVLRAQVGGRYALDEQQIEWQIRMFAEVGGG